MNANVNRQWVLRSRPDTQVSAENFEFRESPRPSIGAGEMLIRTLYLSFDPTQRGWLNDAPGYMPPVAIGEPMRAAGIGQVIESNRPGFAAGDLVQGLLGWQDYVVSRGEEAWPLQKIPGTEPLTHYLSIYGLTGPTAYFGMIEVGQVRAGDVVLVSGAAGATGSVAGQIARIKGASKVIGIAGGPQKCAWLTGTAGFDAAIDYRSEKLNSRIRALAPRGVDVFYDNVGGEALDAALLNLAFHARVVICGGISSGYGTKIPPGPKHYMQLIFKSARMEGFLLMNYADRMPKALADLATWVKEGRIRFEEDVLAGLEHAPEGLRRLFEGGNLGKQLLKVADPPLPL